MKKSLQVVIVIVALQVAFCCVNLVIAGQRTGGYKEIPGDNPDAVAAANFAVGEQGQKQGASVSLVSIERAESQVVAGVNYRLCLKVETDDETQEVKVVVYRNLKKEYSLTSWTEVNCDGTDAHAAH